MLVPIDRFLTRTLEPNNASPLNADAAALWSNTTGMFFKRFARLRLPKRFVSFQNATHEILPPHQRFVLIDFRISYFYMNSSCTFDPCM